MRRSLEFENLDCSENEDASRCDRDQRGRRDAQNLDDPLPGGCGIRAAANRRKQRRVGLSDRFVFRPIWMQQLCRMPAISGMELGDGHVNVVIDRRWRDAELAADFLRAQTFARFHEAGVLPLAEIGDAGLPTAIAALRLIARRVAHEHTLAVKS